MTTFNSLLIEDTNFLFTKRIFIEALSVRLVSFNCKSYRCYCIMVFNKENRMIEVCNDEREIEIDVTNNNRCKLCNDRCELHE